MPILYSSYNQVNFQVSAPVAFAGLAPGFVGLYQLNVQVPSSTPSGAVRVFVVMPNGFSSQNGVFLYVQ